MSDPREHMGHTREPERCSASVSESGGFHSYPCSRAGKVERDGKWYCKQHDPAAVKERREARDRKFRERYARETEHSRRQAAAVNACAGIPTEELERGVIADLRMTLDLAIDALVLNTDDALRHSTLHTARDLLRRLDPKR